MMRKSTPTEISVAAAIAAELFKANEVVVFDVREPDVILRTTRLARAAIRALHIDFVEKLDQALAVAMRDAHIGKGLGPHLPGVAAACVRTVNAYINEASPPDELPRTPAADETFDNPHHGHDDET